ncbi:MAG: 3-demethylubiquinone-9 3-O-methyltransferase [Planctomycetes bacterium]|nr:3-demethylubiquinone-9 3-O-methyltransferase [Planctomycetota bacterium]
MSSAGVVPRNDLDLYARHADGWWSADDRAFRSLRAVKQHHLAVLDARLAGALAGLRVADLGCGGGLLSIPLAERGAAVVGVDRSGPSLAAARAEAARRGLRCSFVEADLRASGLPAASFELVVLSDVVEHLQPFAPALAEAARLLVPGGLAYVNTLNRTRRAAWLAVRLAEGLGLVPRGTHDPALFVRPVELCDAAATCGLWLERLCGERVRLWRTLRAGALHLRASRSFAVSYGAFFVRGES